jgi:hypothetical protein
MPAGRSGSGDGSPDATAAAKAADGTASSAAPRTPPMVQPQRSGAARNATFEDAASGSDDFDDANSWAGGSPESSMSAYYSPRWARTLLF